MRRTSERTISLSVKDIELLLKQDATGVCPADGLGINDLRIMLKGYVFEEPNSWSGFCSDDCYSSGDFELDDEWKHFSIWCRDASERDEIFNRILPVLRELRKLSKASPVYVLVCTNEEGEVVSTDVFEDLETAKACMRSSFYRQFREFERAYSDYVASAPGTSTSCHVKHGCTDAYYWTILRSTINKTKSHGN